MQAVKCVLVGDEAVGKTYLLMTYATNSFPTEYHPESLGNYSANVMLGKTVINLSLWDTPGQEDYSQVRQISYSQTDVFLVCFSIASPDSFANVSQRWFPEISHYCPDAPKILVGTMSDLRNNDETLKQLKQTKLNPITSQDANALAEELGAATYLECSSLTQSGLKDLFDEAIKIAMNHNAQTKDENKCTCVLL